MFSISTISRDPENPTIIRRDHTMHGEATVDSLSTLGIGESNVTVTSDENGKIIVSMTQESNTPIQVDATHELLDGYQPEYTPVEAPARAERTHRQNKLLGGAAMRGVFTAETFSYYKAAYDRLDNDTDFWTRTTTSDSNNPLDNGPYNTRDSVTNIDTGGVTSDGPMRTVDDVRNRIANMRAANLSDKEIKKTLLKEVHPDFNPGIDPEFAKVVTNEFRPQPQEYRNHNGTSQAAHTESTPEAAASAPGSEQSTPRAASGSSAEVVPVSAPAPQTQASSSDFTQAA